MKIGIVGGSVREGRKSEAIAQWVLDIANQRDDAEFEYLDVASFNIPLLTSPTHPMMAGGNYDSDEVNAWARAVGACDAFIFVTPEYNHAVPGAFKNAVDSLGQEWVGKVIGFIGYGSVGGVRAIENWRQIIANFQMVDVRAEVNLSLFTDFDEDGFAPDERRAEEVGAVLDQVVTMAGKLA